MQATPRIQSITLRRRMEAAFIAFSLGFGLLIGRLAWIQWWERAHFKRLADQFHVRIISSPAARGSILDRTGQPLASNLIAFDVCANPRVIADPAATARAVAELFGGDAAAYQAKLE